MSKSNPLISAAIAGLLLGGSACASQPSNGSGEMAPAAETESSGAALEKHACKGQNECKGKGGCKVEGKHDCKGQNECKGQGGCG